MCSLLKVRVLSLLTHFASALDGIALRGEYGADRIYHKPTCPSYFHPCILASSVICPGEHSL